MYRSNYCSTNNFNAFVIKYQNYCDFELVQLEFERVLHYSWITVIDNIEELPIYEVYWIYDDIVFQHRVLVGESDLIRHIAFYKLIVYEKIFESTDLIDFVSFLKRVKAGFIDPASLYAPKKLIFD